MATEQFPTGPDDLSTLPERQHAWADYIQVDRAGNPKFPNHQAFVMLDYTGPSPPTAEAREQVEMAFRTLERAFKRGVGSNSRALLNEGLLFTISYSPSFFDMYDESLPEDMDLVTPERLLERLDADTSKADDYDAVLHLGSDRPEVLLGAESALFGEIDRVNGTERQGSLAGIFERAERRTGFVGQGLPKEKLRDDIPAESPISMGFKSSFADGFPPEDKVTITEGPFAGATLKQISMSRNHLDDWYGEDKEDRVELMFSPHHDSDQIGTVGEDLGSESGMTDRVASKTMEDARSSGRVGHGQKLARVRDEDDDPLVLRRGDFNSAVSDGARLHFGAIQETMEDFVKTRRAMEELDLEGTGDAPDLPSEEHGILEFTDVMSRSTFLMPPRSHRSLPKPRPE